MPDKLQSRKKDFFNFSDGKISLCPQVNKMPTKWISDVLDIYLPN